MTSVVTAKKFTIGSTVDVRHPRPRVGKTKKDKARNAANTAYQNREARASWQNNGGPFPYANCNGKRNRHLFTGRGNTQIILTIKSASATTSKAKK